MEVFSNSKKKDQLKKIFERILEFQRRKETSSTLESPETSISSEESTFELKSDFSNSQILESSNNSSSKNKSLESNGDSAEKIIGDFVLQITSPEDDNNFDARSSRSGFSTKSSQSNISRTTKATDRPDDTTDYAAKNGEAFMKMLFFCKSREELITFLNFTKDTQKIIDSPKNNNNDRNIKIDLISRNRKAVEQENVAKEEVKIIYARTGDKNNEDEREIQILELPREENIAEEKMENITTQYTQLLEFIRKFANNITVEEAAAKSPNIIIEQTDEVNHRLQSAINFFFYENIRRQDSSEQDQKDFSAHDIIMFTDFYTGIAVEKCHINQNLIKASEALKSVEEKRNIAEIQMSKLFTHLDYHNTAVENYIIDQLRNNEEYLKNNIHTLFGNLPGYSVTFVEDLVSLVVEKNLQNYISQDPKKQKQGTPLMRVLENKYYGADNSDQLWKMIDILYKNGFRLIATREQKEQDGKDNDSSYIISNLSPQTPSSSSSRNAPSNIHKRIQESGIYFAIACAAIKYEKNADFEKLCESLIKSTVQNPLFKLRLLNAISDRDKKFLEEFTRDKLLGNAENQNGRKSYPKLSSLIEDGIAHIHNLIQNKSSDDIEPDLIYFITKSSLSLKSYTLLAQIFTNVTSKIIEQSLSNRDTTDLIISAIEIGRHENLRFMLENISEEKRERILNSPINEMNETPLHYAVKHNLPTIVSLLIEHGANPGAAVTSGAEDVNGVTPSGAADVNGVTPFMLAAARPSLFVFTSLVNAINKRGAKLLPSIINQQDLQGRTALHHAAENGRGVDRINILFGNKAKINLRTLHGLTPANLAMRKGATHTFGYIEKHSEDKNSRVIQVADTAGAEQILKHPKRDNALFIALDTGASYETFAKIFEAKINPYHPNERGLNAIEYACSGSNYLGLSNFLTAAHEYYKEQNNENEFYQLINYQNEKTGYTPLHYAVLSGQEKIVDLLIEHGADITITDTNNNNLLHQSVRSGTTSTLSILMQKIKNKEIFTQQNKDGYNFYSLSCEIGDAALFKAVEKVTSVAFLDNKNSGADALSALIDQNISSAKHKVIVSDTIQIQVNNDAITHAVIGGNDDILESILHKRSNPLERTQVIGLMKIAEQKNYYYTFGILTDYLRLNESYYNQNAGQKDLRDLSEFFYIQEEDEIRSDEDGKIVLSPQRQILESLILKGFEVGNEDAIAISSKDVYLEIRRRNLEKVITKIEVLKSQKEILEILPQPEFKDISGQIRIISGLDLDSRTKEVKAALSEFVDIKDNDIFDITSRAETLTQYMESKIGETNDNKEANNILSRKHLVEFCLSKNFATKYKTDFIKNILTLKENEKVPKDRLLKNIDSKCKEILESRTHPNVVVERDGTNGTHQLQSDSNEVVRD